MFKRILDLSKFKHSFFLFGPRQVGKTFLIKNTLITDIYIDLFKQAEFLRYSKNPALISREITAVDKKHGIVVIDEVQRYPELLNEVQVIMGDWPEWQFVLTGSSARKLKRAGVNLLGGRAITLHLHPLTNAEMGASFYMEEVLRFGALPHIVLEKDREAKIRLLQSYVEVYLKEEVQQEALTRNIPAFSKFLELAAFENGNLLNFQNIAREVGIHSKTIKEYFSILEDTLLGFYLYPFTRSHRAKLIAHPKFYFFDPGVVNALQGSLSQEAVPGTVPFGRMFEHFVILEIKRALDYAEKEVKVSFFRTSDGAEVDLILEFRDEVWAIEIKSQREPKLSDVRGLRSFIRDHKVKRAVCLCLTPRPFKENVIEFLHWREFLAEL